MAADRTEGRSTSPEWTVLLIGGSSGVGKSRQAATIARRLRVPWMQVDDLRLALQFSRPVLPGGAEWALTYFDDPDRWRTPEAARDALVAICGVLVPALETVVANHVAQHRPIVLEGDGIDPALLAAERVREHAQTGVVKAVFVVEPDEATLLDNMVIRRDGGDGQADDALRGWARASWLHGRWLADAAGSRGAPVVPPRPWGTLARRSLAAAGPRRLAAEPGSGGV